MPPVSHVSCSNASCPTSRETLNESLVFVASGRGLACCWRCTSPSTQRVCAASDAPRPQDSPPPRKIRMIDLPRAVLTAATPSAWDCGSASYSKGRVDSARETRGMQRPSMAKTRIYRIWLLSNAPSQLVPPAIRCQQHEQQPPGATEVKYTNCCQTETPIVDALCC